MDLGRSKWRNRASALADARYQLERETFLAYRDPLESERDAEQYKGHEERLKRCCAFGQHADPVEPGDQKRAQHGLFGTSAALAVLSTSRWAQALPDGGGHADDDAWQDRYLKTLNFLDLAVASSVDGERPPPLSAQRNMTLRACMALRAVATAYAPLTAPSLADALAAGIGGDLSAEPAFLASRLGEEIAGMLTSCVVPAREIEGAWSPGDSTAHRTWRYSTGDESIPRSPDEWVFVWAQVISSVVRAAKAGVVNRPHAESLLGESDLRAFRETVLSPPPDLDRRFQLMGLWALAHLDNRTETGRFAHQICGNDTYMALADEQIDAVRRTIKSLSLKLLKNEVELVDSWRPYSLKPSGNAWRDDFMVVPVVPILLVLIARYRSFTCSDAAVLTLVRRSVTESDQRDLGRSRPYQMGSRDGTVNLAYYHETYSALEGMATAISNSGFARAKATSYGFWRGWGRALVFGLTVTIIVLSYLGLLDSPSDIGLGLLFGLGAAYLAAISTPPVIAFFWGDKY